MSIDALLTFPVVALKPGAEMTLVVSPRWPTVVHCIELTDELRGALGFVHVEHCHLTLLDCRVGDPLVLGRMDKIEARFWLDLFEGAGILLSNERLRVKLRNVSPEAVDVVMVARGEELGDDP